MIDAILGIFTSSGVGAITGMIGSWLTKREERELLTLKYRHALDMGELKQAGQQLMADIQLKLMDKQIDLTTIQGEWDAFTESVKSQQVTTGSKLADAVRGLMRPLITIYLLVIATILTLKIGALVGGLEVLEPESLMTIYKDAIQQLVFLLTVAVTWWFGSRPSSQRK